MTHQDWPPAWTAHELRPRYDVVIIGGGVHGLAAACYLASRPGITDVAVLDKGYIGSGGSGRNTAIRCRPSARSACSASGPACAT